MVFSSGAAWAISLGPASCIYLVSISSGSQDVPTPSSSHTPTLSSLRTQFSLFFFFFFLQQINFIWKSFPNTLFKLFEAPQSELRS